MKYIILFLLIILLLLINNNTIETFYFDEIICSNYTTEDTCSNHSHKCEFKDPSCVELPASKQANCPKMRKVKEELKKTWNNIPWTYTIGNGTIIKKWQDYLKQDIPDDKCYMDTIPMPNCNDGC